MGKFLYDPGGVALTSGLWYSIVKLEMSQTAYFRAPSAHCPSGSASTDKVSGCALRLFNIWSVHLCMLRTAKTPRIHFETTVKTNIFCRNGGRKQRDRRLKSI